MLDSQITIHEAEDYMAMRKAGTLAAQVLDYITPYVEPGVSTGHLDRLCHDYIIAEDAIPAPLNYRGFPKSICTSINHVVCHGIPDDEKILADGDIINIDVTVIKDGWHGDTSRMFFVGDKVSIKAKRLVSVTYEAMMRGIECIKPGLTLGELGYNIQSFAEKQGYSVVRDFCGHGIGRVFHDRPNILHYGKIGQGEVLKPGMFFTVEPMLNIGKYDVKLLSDGWTVVTRDRQLSAQFEHTIAVTETGYEIFTQSPKGWSQPPYA